MGVIQERATARRKVTAGRTISTTDILAQAALQAKQRNFADLLIVDADAHHYESESWAAIADRIEDPVLRRQALGGGTRQRAPSPQKGSSFLGGGWAMDIDMTGRIPRMSTRGEEKGDETAPRDVVLTRRVMDAMGIDHTILFPGPMLRLGMHPVVQVEVAVSRAYAMWMTETILPADSHITTLLYLPFNDPRASVRLVEEFADRPGVVGFMVGGVRHNAVHDDAYMPLYRELERRGLPLGFHGSHDWTHRSFDLLNNFLAVHALGFPFHTMVNMTNWVLNGIPERFPGLRTVWIEGGLAFVPFLMQRLDHEYMMRTSEAPLLTKKPSDYMREFYYTSQPLELVPGGMDQLKLTFDLISATTQLMYASDYPHFDFDLPSRVYDLPFLSETARRRILGENAMDVFKLDRR